MKNLKYISFLLVAAALGLFTDARAQYAERGWSVSLNINYTTTAKLYLNPNAPDQIVRNSYVPLEKLTSPSIDIRYSLSDDILLGFSTEYIKKTDLKPDLAALSPSRGTVNIMVEDGFKLIPFELSAYYLMPFSSETFKLLMGGGVAYYYGQHIRSYQGNDVSNVSRDFAYGIQASVSGDYMINKFLSIRGEMKFRDPEFEVTSKYNTRVIDFEGQTLIIPHQEFQSKVNIDGMTFTLGLAIHI